MSFLAAAGAGLGAGVLGGVGSQLLGKAFAPKIDPNMVKNPFEGAAGQRVTGQIDDLNAMDQMAFRNAQLGQLGYLQQQAQGQGPSIANMQADRAAQGLAAQQMAMAQGGPANQAAMSQRLAAQNVAQGQADIGGQAAQARLQEIEMANRMLMGATQSGRGQDIQSQGLAQNYEQLLANAALEAQRQKVGLLGMNMDSQQKTAAGFASAIGGGMSGAMGAMGK